MQLYYKDINNEFKKTVVMPFILLDDGTLEEIEKWELERIKKKNSSLQ